MTKKELIKLENKVALVLVLEGYNSPKEYFKYPPLRYCDYCEKQPWVRVVVGSKMTLHYCMYKNEVMMDERGKIYFRPKATGPLNPHLVCVGWIAWPSKRKGKE